MNEGLLLSSAAPAVVLGCLLGWLRARKAVLGSLVVGMTLVHELLLIVLPVWYAVFTGFRLERAMIARVDARDLLRVMVGETCFVLVFALALAFCVAAGWGGRKKRVQGASVWRENRRVEMTLYTLAILGWINYGFGTANAVSTLSSDPNVPAIDILRSIVLAFFWFSSLTACALMLARHDGPRKRATRALIAVVPLASVFIIGVTTGIRGRVVWVVSLLVLGGLLNRRKRLVWIGLGTCVLLLPVFSFFGGAYRFIDKKELMSEFGAYKTIMTIVEEAGRSIRDQSGELGEGILEGLAFRAQGPRNSATLYQEYDRGGGPGFGVYLGAWLFPVPRLIWPGKPVAGGTDATSLSSAMYRAPELAYGDHGTNGPVLASAHAYWEGGWAFVLAAGAITGVVWSGLLALERCLPREIAAIMCFVAGAALLIDGLLTMLAPLYALVIAGWQSILPVALIYLCSSYIVRTGGGAGSDPGAVGWRKG